MVSLVLGAQLGKLDLRSLAILGTPLVQSAHDYYPFPLEDLGQLALMTAELVDRLAITVSLCRFYGMGTAESRSLRSDSYVRMHHFVRRLTDVPFRRFLVDVRLEFIQCLFAVLHATLGSYLGDALQEGNANVVACLPVPRA
jgi:hypothetical protein